MTNVPDFTIRIYRLGFLIVLVLVVIDLIAFFYYPDSIVGELFLATRERTPMTWISALTFFFIGLSSFWAYSCGKGKIWFFLALTYLFFSMDDATYFHERLSGYFADNNDVLSAFPTYIWVVLYFPILVFSLCALVILLWKDVTAQKKKMIVFAVIALGIAVCLDLLDGFVAKDPIIVFCIEWACNEAVLHMMRLVEEVLEILALGILGLLNVQIHFLKKKKD